MVKRYTLTVLYAGLTLLLGAISLFAQDDPLHDIDLTRLPLGDGNITYDAPQAGYVFSCSDRFGGGGAFTVGEWIDKVSGIFDYTANPIVDGEITWASGFEIALDGDTRVITGNGLPNQPSGTFPVATEDDAYDYDRNPNSIEAYALRLELPAYPEIADEPSCLGLGTVGMMLTGNVFFNALDARGEDALAHEIQDACQGHPEITGTYHYHTLSTCLEGESTGEHSPLVGYALDGFGIYGRYGDDGEVLTNDALDECHGHVGIIEWDGERVEMYHYHATWEYPYTLGCYRGTPVRTRIASVGV